MKEFLAELINESGELAAHYFHSRNFSIEQKANDTPVTVADREAELVMRKMINKRFPDHGIIGEEYGRENDQAEYVWVLDPIDGTIAFIHGVPLFVTLIALLKNGQPILGAINQPVAKLTCIGDNDKAWLNGEEVSMRGPRPIEEASLLTTCLPNISRHHGPNGMAELIKKTKVFRTWGDGFGYLLLASGKADIMIDAKMAPWDILPVIPVVRGAGAKITTLDGADPVFGDSALCAHPESHEWVLSQVKPISSDLETVKTQRT